MFVPDKSDDRLSIVSKDFLEFARVELSYAPESIIKYRDCYRQIEKAVGDLAVSHFTKDDLFRLRLYMTEKQHSASRQTNLLVSIKRLLLFVRDEQGTTFALDPNAIRMPKRPRRAVQFLAQDEVARLVGCIRLTTHRGKPHLANLRLRALIEVLLGSGMRIGEALSLDRSHIDYVKREARIIGKGNKERVVFFTERSLYWLQEYFSLRNDQHPAVFASLDGEDRLKRPARMVAIVHSVAEWWDSVWGSSNVDAKIPEYRFVKAADFLYEIGPISLKIAEKSTDYYLILNAQYVFSMPKSAAAKETAMFRLRNQAFANFQFWLGNHGSRPGMLMVR